MIAERLADPILLVQGPPGTGKTHTLAWAILGRAYAAARAGRTFHVLVTAMTHTAVEVVLRSLARQARAARRGSGHDAHRGGAVRSPAVQGAVESAMRVPDGVEAIDRDDLLECLEHDLAVIAAVPSGVHRLLQGVCKPIDWSRKHFDLLVIDEASQLSLPAAVLGGCSATRRRTGDRRRRPPADAADPDARLEARAAPRRAGRSDLRVDVRVAARP